MVHPPRLWCHHQRHVAQQSRRKHRCSQHRTAKQPDHLRHRCLHPQSDECKEQLRRCKCFAGVRLHRQQLGQRCLQLRKAAAHQGLPRPANQNLEVEDERLQHTWARQATKQLHQRQQQWHHQGTPDHSARQAGTSSTGTRAPGTPGRNCRQRLARHQALQAATARNGSPGRQHQRHSRHQALQAATAGNQAPGTPGRNCRQRLARPATPRALQAATAAARPQRQQHQGAPDPHATALQARTAQPLPPAPGRRTSSSPRT